MFILDSSALIEVWEGGPRKEKVLQIAGNEFSVTTSICMHEVLYGARSEKRRFLLENLFANIAVLQHDYRSAKIGARMEQELGHLGLKLARIDIMIAAICIVNDATLVTLDKGFERIEGLKLEWIK